MNRKMLAFLLILASIAIAVLGAPTKPYSDLVDGGTLTAKFLIGTFNVLFNWANGNITNANIATSAAIIGTKLANGTITTLQILDGTILEEDLSATYTASLSAHIANSVATLSASVTAALASTSLTANAHIASSSGVHGVTGSVVGTSDLQSISNKNISSFTMTATPTTSMQPVNKGLLDVTVASYLPRAGGTSFPMTGDFYMNNNEFFYSYLPGNSTSVSLIGVDTANNVYIGDTTASTVSFVNKAYFSDTVSMVLNKITDLGYPTSGADAVNMNYVTAVNASIGIELTLLTDAIATWSSDLTDAIADAIASVEAKIASITASGGLYLPLTGGATFPMSGDLFLDNAISLKSKTSGGTAASLIGLDGTNMLNIGGSIASRARMYPQLDMNEQRVINATSPIDNNDLATKFYVDNRTATGVFNAQISSSTFNGGLSTGTEIVNALASSCQIVNSTFSGSYVSATDLRAGGNQITEVGTPTYDAGAVNLGYLNAVSASFCNIATIAASMTWTTINLGGDGIATHTYISNASGPDGVYMLFANATICPASGAIGNLWMATYATPSVLLDFEYGDRRQTDSAQNRRVNLFSIISIASGSTEGISLGTNCNDQVYVTYPILSWLSWVRIK